MQPICINRYSNPDAVGYAGTIAPDDERWIIFVDTDGMPHLWVRGDALESIDTLDEDDASSTYFPAWVFGGETIAGRLTEEEAAAMGDTPD